MKTRPKVRYKAFRQTLESWFVCPSPRPWFRSNVAMTETRGGAERIAAALNLHEAVRRGEIKIVEEK